jgi:putative flippase GtrA
MLNASWARFGVVGVANTMLGLGVIYSLKATLAMGDAAANVIGYAVAMVAGFFLNRRWTFAHRGNAYAAFVRYLGVLACAYLANLATVLGLIGLLTLDGYLAQALGILPYTVITYAGARFIAFPVQATPGSCWRQAGQRS